MDAVVSSSFMMDRLAIFFCIFGVFYFTNLAFSGVLNYSEERKDLCKIAGIQGRECTPEEKALVQAGYEARQRAENERKRADAERERAVSAEKDKEFHAKISALILFRDTSDAFKKNVLEPYCGYQLDDAKNIKSVLRDFLNHGYYKSWNTKLQDLSNDLYHFVTKTIKVHVDKYVDDQDIAYKYCNNFIHSYKIYCQSKLDDEECKLLIHMAPNIPTYIRDIMGFLVERI